MKFDLTSKVYRLKFSESHQFDNVFYYAIVLKSAKLNFLALIGLIVYNQKLKITTENVKVVLTVTMNEF